MTRIRSLLFAVAAFAAAALPQSAFATASVQVSKQVLCRPESSVGTPGPSYVTNPATGGGSYVLNNQGCALMVQGDWAYFQSQGYQAAGGGSLGQIFAGPFTAQTTTANSPTLPANAYIEAIIVQEVSGNAVTGGLDIGVAGSSDATIASAFAIAANCVCALTDAALLKKVFPTSGTTGPAAQQIFFNAHTNWSDSASIYVTILYRYF